MAGAAGEVIIGVNADTGKLQGQLKGLGGMFESVLGANILSNPINTFLDGFKDKLDAAVARVDTLNKFPQVMQTMGFAAEDAQASIDKLKDGVTGLPTALDDIVSTTQSLAVLTGDLQGATDTALALNNAFLASGATSADASRGLVQYSQMLAKGTVDMQSWRTLQETMGFALKETAEAFGFAGESAVNDFYSALQSGEVTFSEFNDKLVELSEAEGGFADMAQESVGGIATTMTNAETAVVRGVANIVDSFDSMYNVQNMIATGGSAVEAVLNGIANNLNVIIPLVVGIGATVAVWKLAQAGTDSFRTSSQSLSQALEKVDGDTSKLTMTLTRQSAETRNAASAELQAVAREKQATAERKRSIATLKQHTATTKQATAAKKELAAAAAREKAQQAQETAAQKEGAEADAAAAEAAQLAAEADELQAEADEAAEEAKQALKDATNAATEADNAETEATTAETNAQEENNTVVSLGQVIVGVMTKKLQLKQAATLLAKSAVEKLNAAWQANPIGFVLSIVTAAITAFKALAEAVSTSTDESKEFREAAEESAEAMAKLREETEQGVNVNFEKQAQEAEKLVASMDGLIGKTDLTATEQAVLQTRVEQLNSLFPQMNLELQENGQLLDKNTGSYIMTTDAMRAYVEEMKKTAEAEAYMDIYKEAIKEAAQQTIDAEKATNDLAEALGNLHPNMNGKQIAAEIEEIQKLLTFGDVTAHVTDITNAFNTLKASLSGRGLDAGQLSQIRDEVDSIRDAMINGELTVEEYEARLNSLQNMLISGGLSTEDAVAEINKLKEALSENAVDVDELFWYNTDMFDGATDDAVHAWIELQQAQLDAAITAQEAMAQYEALTGITKAAADALDEEALAEQKAAEIAEKAAQTREQIAQSMTKEGETVEDLAAKWGISVDQIIDEASQLEGDASDKLDAWAQATQEAYDKAYAAMEERGAAIITKNDEIINSFEKLETNANGISFEKGMSTWEDNIQKQNEFEAAMLEFAEVATPQAVAQMRELGISHADWLQEMLKSPEALAQFEENVKQSMQSAADSAERESARISEEIQTAFNTANRAAGYQIDEMGTIVDTKTEKIVEDVSKQKELWGNAGIENGTELVTGIANGVEETTDQSTTAVEQTMTEAHTAAQTKANDGSWQQVGTQISRGIAQGIRTGSSYVTEAVRQIVQSALNAAKSAAEINSPSKLFARVVGKGIPEGIAVGIEKNLNAMKKPIYEMRKFAYDGAVDIPAVASTTAVHEAYNEIDINGLTAQNELLERQINATNALLNKDWGISVDGRQLAIATNAANAAMGARTYKGSIGDKY